MNDTTSEYILVKESSIHHKGIFAKKEILKGTKVIEYVGDKITEKESDKRSERTFDENEKNPDHGSVYLFELDKKHDLDGDVPYNTARFINHSCDPNCETEIDNGKIWIIAIRDIKEGEEINYDYGYDLEDFENHPCKCNSKNCVGYIVAEEDRPKLLKKIISKKELALNLNQHKK